MLSYPICVSIVYKKFGVVGKSIGPVVVVTPDGYYGSGCGILLGMMELVIH